MWVHSRVARAGGQATPLLGGQSCVGARGGRPRPTVEMSFKVNIGHAEFYERHGFRATGTEVKRD